MSDSLELELQTLALEIESESSGRAARALSQGATSPASR